MICPTCKGKGTVLWRIGDSHRGNKVITVPCPNVRFHRTQEQIDYDEAMTEVNQIATGIALEGRS
jgi:hypothetical protein